MVPLLASPSVYAAEPKKNLEDGQVLGEGQDARGYGGLARRIVIFISGKPWLINEGTIDGMVGNRKTLEGATRKKIDALHPRLRMELYTYFTENIHHLSLQGTSPGSETPHGELMPMSLSTDRATVLLNNSQNTLKRHFSTSELIDLSVYKLSENNFFPTSTESAWRHTKKLVVRYDIALGLGIAGIMAAQDDLSLRISGWVFQFSGDRVRLGWYANAQDMGIHWRPTFDVGVAVATKESTLRVGAVEHPGANTSEVGRAFQARFSHYWEETTKNGGHWEFTSHAAIKWIAESQDPRQHRDAVGNVEVYARRPLILLDPSHADGEESEYAVMLKTSLESNFVDRYSINGGVTLENEKRHLQISILGRISQSFENQPAQEISRPDCFVGILLGGDFIAEFERLKQEYDARRAKAKEESLNRARQTQP